MPADEHRAANQQLVAGLANTGTNRGYWTGEHLAFAGFADPESAMKSTLAAWISGDGPATRLVLEHCERSANTIARRHERGLPCPFAWLGCRRLDVSDSAG